jgi:CRP/FNR family cyclic AMP-dependent transcriptional regulator
MKARFQGEAGSRNLLAAMMEQRVVEHHGAVAEALIIKGELVEFAEAETFIEQGGSDTVAYFILAGEARVYINHREVACRGQRELVGEMVILEPAAPRSATLRASAGMVALRINGHDLENVADEYPLLWRAIGRIVSERLRARARFHRLQNEEPILFIGSSTESLDIVREIEEHFKHDKICIRPWTTGVFGPGGIPFDDLLKQAREADFALFVASPDEKVYSRGNDELAPRDNVIFELGMFMDRLGRERAFLLKERRLDMKIPTDLLGITPLTYIHNGARSLSQQLGPPCNELRKLMRGLGAL